MSITRGGGFLKLVYRALIVEAQNYVLLNGHNTQQILWKVFRNKNCQPDFDTFLLQIGNIEGWSLLQSPFRPISSCSVRIRDIFVPFYVCTFDWHAWQISWFSTRLPVPSQFSVYWSMNVWVSVMSASLTCLHRLHLDPRLLKLYKGFLPLLSCFSIFLREDKFL